MPHNLKTSTRSHETRRLCGSSSSSSSTSSSSRWVEKGRVVVMVDFLKARRYTQTSSLSLSLSRMCIQFSNSIFDAIYIYIYVRVFTTKTLCCFERRRQDIPRVPLALEAVLGNARGPRGRDGRRETNAETHPPSQGGIDRHHRRV